jgi:hypothetical protein
VNGRTKRLVLAISAVLLLALAAVAALIVSGGGSSSGLQPGTLPAAVERFPAPPAGAFVAAREDGSNVLALAVGPKPHGVGLQVSEVTQDGSGAPALHVSFTVTSAGGRTARVATDCGAGCYRADLALASRPLSVDVRIARTTRTTRWHVPLPASWPARDAGSIVAHAERTWRALRSLRYHERLASDEQHAVVSDWQIVAPDRLSYQIVNGGAAVIVGRHRWDRQPGGAWVKSSALELHQPDPFWVKATNARIVGSATMRGRAVWRVSFFDPRTPGWFIVAIDKATFRTLDVRMTAAAHFMHDAYRSFNTSIKIAPPTAR